MNKSNLISIFVYYFVFDKYFCVVGEVRIRLTDSFTKRSSKGQERPTAFDLFPASFVR